MKNIEAKRFNKVLILKGVKNFTYTTEELAYHTELEKSKKVIRWNTDIKIFI